VLEEEDVIIAWLRTHTEGRRGHLQVLLRPGHESVIDTLIAFLMNSLRLKSAISALVPEYQPGIAPSLKAAAFQERGTYTSFVKQLSVRVRVPSLVPVQA
jgi:hypothetical protein